jgi:hypothetical protein
LKGEPVVLPRAIPPTRCTAHAKSTGETCGKWAIPGTHVCRLHGGGAPRVTAKAAATRTLAELLRADPRPVWDVILDSVHTADALAQEQKLALLDGQPVTPDALARITDAIKLAHSFATAAVTAKAYDLRAQRVQVEAEAIAHVLRAVTAPLLRALHLPDGDEEALQLWVNASLRQALTNVSAGARTESEVSRDVPRPPLAVLSAARGDLATPAGARGNLAALPALPPGSLSSNGDASSGDASAVITGEVVPEPGPAPPAGSAPQAGPVISGPVIIPAPAVPPPISTLPLDGKPQ